MPDLLDLGLFCDRFLHTLYGFHITEFNAMLEHFSNARVYTFSHRAGSPYTDKYFKKNIMAYEKEYPHLGDRVHQLYPELNHPDPRLATHTILSVKHGKWVRPRHAYNIFVMNTILFLPMWEHLEIPFSFTLYPGGGFRMAPGPCNKGLERIFKSPMFRSVTVNMKNTRKFIQEQFAVPDDKILYIYGGPIAVSYYKKHRSPKKRYPVDKATLDVCFVANRYTQLGVDKGYDEFVAVAHLLKKRYSHIRFHVVGDSFTPEVLNVRELGDTITFYGARSTKWLADFFGHVDIFFSASVPDVICRGAFDGFPTTSAVESALCGVAIATSDPLGLNEVFTDQRDIILLKPNPAAIYAKILPYLDTPDRLYNLAEAGNKTTERFFGEDAQLKPRCARLRQLIAEEDCRNPRGAA